MTYQDGFPVRGPRPPVTEPGVPSQYITHVHPYPTRFHGGIWTRPVTAPATYVQSVQSVFKPDNFNENNPGIKKMGIDGLGALQYQTYDGVFGGEKHGGGIFSGPLYGVGAPPLGAECFVPSVCKQVKQHAPGSMNVSLIDKYCNYDASGQRDIDKMCNRAYAAHVAPKLAADPAAAKTAAGQQARTVVKTAYPWNAYSTATLALQREANLKLQARGYQTLKADGVLGPGTCGAVKTMGMTPPPTCKKFRTPTKATTRGTTTVRTTAATPTTTTTAKGAPLTTMAYKPPGAMSNKTKAVIGVGAGAIAAGGLYLLLAKKRKSA